MAARVGVAESGRPFTMLHEVISEIALRSPEEPALIDDDLELTFAQLDDRIRRTISLIYERTSLGDRIAVIGANHHIWVELYYAVPAAGRVLVFLNHRLAPNEIKQLMDRSGVGLIIGEPSQLERLEFTTRIGTGVEAIDWSSWALERDATDVGVACAADPGALAWLLFTSGTTAAPKGAMLSHRSVLAAVEASSAARPVEDDDVYLFPFPLCHVAGYNVVHRHVAGRPVVLVDRFDPMSFCAVVRERDVTSTSLAATMLATLLDHLDTDPQQLAMLRSLRSIAYGAAPMSPSLLRRAHELLGVDFAQGYGMTELSGNAVFLDAGAHRIGLAGDEAILRAAGRPAPGVELRLADDGEILVRAPQAMIGYWEDDEATAAALVDGWLATGDVGRIDERGFLHVIDRSKDIIITGGENVSSREVEDVLISAPGVARVAVVGEPDARWGERVCAVIVPLERTRFDEAEVLAHARRSLAGFKIPKRVLLVEELPVNASGKVLKNELRQALAR
ncbi:MAG: AMP-binding protein [Actinobacteria bacterium]|uniref:Unannotated protein n=1 Tax=freshwater metagenome TaxID=449393 RepID=A0A6J7I6C7_9ZZZZ|nr:AMP-binding protein [Actinomycetota bacterium]